ncbi:MAG: hypothetical protein K5695_15320 [Oscillospiraceae bacterium]|nr:hypothetical protein [Oscillospiraceae bacterium]
MSKEYITAHGTVPEAELMQCIAEYQSDRTNAYAVWTNRFACAGQFDGSDLAHLQEVRIFCEEREFRARRSGDAFLWRVIDDEAFRTALAGEPDAFLGKYENRIFDESHCLDIDKKETQGTAYTTTGGGHYTLPEEGLETVQLRNYLDYDEDGIVQVTDFRLVGFRKGV